MEEHPDSSLAILDTLDRSRLCSRKLLARHSLLYSQALEKNDILLETDSVIAPAVKYYRRHGSADERLLMQYYQGCIRWNAGNLDEALDCFLRAERYARKAKDYQAVGRLYSAMKSIYYEVYEFARSFDYSLKAAEYYAMSSDTVLQSKSLIMAVKVAMLMEDNGSADSILNYMHDTLWSGMDISQRGRYYLSEVLRLQDYCINEAMSNVYAYLRTVTDIGDREWGLVSRAYMLAGKVDSARWDWIIILWHFQIMENQHNIGCWSILCQKRKANIGMLCLPWSSMSHWWIKKIWPCSGRIPVLWRNATRMRFSVSDCGIPYYCCQHWG